MKYDREFVLEVLKMNVCVVTFVKVDGEKRTMRATLKDDLIPQTKRMNETIHRAYPADVIRCYDLLKKEWRSFKMDRLEEIYIYDPLEEEDEPTYSLVPGFEEVFLTPAPLSDILPTDNNPESFDSDPPSSFNYDPPPSLESSSDWDD